MSRRGVFLFIIICLSFFGVLGCLWDLCVAQLWERSDIGTDIHTLLCFWREGLGVWRWAGGGGMGKKNEVLLWFQGQSNHNVLPSGWMKLDSALLFFFSSPVHNTSSDSCQRVSVTPMQTANHSSTPAGELWTLLGCHQGPPVSAGSRLLQATHSLRLLRCDQEGI